MLGEKLYNAHYNLPKPNILVIGDVMLDHYIFGSASRLSPEAPVPIVNVKNENKIIGGAANVACNLIDLGATVSLAGITGDDAFGAEIKEILQSKNIGAELILKDSSRTTTVKTRVIASNHQIVRIDQEDTHDIAADLEDTFYTALLPAIEASDIVILSDYNKGLLTPSLSLRVINACHQLHKKVIVDPKGLDYTKYKGAFIIKPNRKELAEAAKTDKIHSQADLEAAAKVIFEATGTDYLIVTLSENGIAIITPSNCTILPVVANQVYDVTGAGDTVIATLAYCVGLGFSIEEACTVANYAASIVIKHIGSATTTIDEILTELTVK
ncbi:D-beta-D-heptose 7-phosphate kinase / D-beta-D-heptose 1-phosphate adenosyltransferase [Pedobacter westerhofensis]|uniref:D-beta-D-heptose 7-phosphate kinase / D-beta-D-heptose 1-phosphate adenosyltransferase n=1 Tax=Pedobacter westerhofensis TaxID=425512 RepID=A0A521E7L9_9SPHI|nr:D-glycero-beta-D-manno-heptose-7-phosphate kinase [Pedobacter westerhofensis]SMO79948.1 D-beta-D-heptose 7-phosphate kinase / D-beta-D-heptose 1-phosphate adenosyltransferase [Pedobacter westerhofensis]